MDIIDRIYGSTTVTSPAILELLSSRPLKRLKGISQYGLPDELNCVRSFSRYEHSVGVMLLLKRLGASDEEQIAGLLHDASHTAFSHVIDWVLLDGRTEDLQDEYHAKYLFDSGLSVILTKYQYSPDRVADLESYSLLERPIPGLCADRLDYSLRESPAELVSKCLAQLGVHEGCIVFEHQPEALAFANNFLKLQAKHWGSYEATARYRLFADALRIAIKDGIISQQDFWEDDAYVLAKLDGSSNLAVRTLLDVLRSKVIPRQGATVTVHKKFRYIDPLVRIDAKTQPLSKLDPDFGRRVNEGRRANERGVKVPEAASFLTAAHSNRN